jgi:sigma-E factor negative regulatory protein RseC
MSSEKGIVESVEDGWAWVVTRRKEMCQDCGHRGSCHMVQGTDRMVIKAKNLAHARKGDEVELYLSTKTKLMGLFILYMFPVLGLLVGAFSANSLSETLGLNQNSGMVMFTLFGLIVAFLLARFLAGRMEASQKLTPLVSRVLRRAISSGPPLQLHSTGLEYHLSRE